MKRDIFRVITILKKKGLIESDHIGDYSYGEKEKHVAITLKLAEFRVTVTQHCES